MKSILGAAMLLLMVACVKDPRDIPGGFDENPEFRLKSQFGNDSFVLDAGINHWTMLPNTYMEDNQWVFGSVFSKDGCIDNCTPSINFTFYQNISNQNSVSGIFQETINPGLKDFVNPSETTDSFQLSFATHPGLFMNGLSYWEDLNSPPPSYMPVFQNQVGSGDGVHVCFQSLQYTGCQYLQCMSYYPSRGNPCIAYIEPQIENPGFIRLMAKPTGTPPFEYLWMFGDSTQTTFVPINSGVTDVYASVKIVDGVGNMTELSQLVKISDGAVDPCFFPIDIKSTRVPAPFEAALADKVAIHITDASGDVWSSTQVLQDEKSHFSIFSVEEYLVAPNDQLSYKVMFTGKILLRNEETNEVKLLEIQEAVIALSHP